MRLYPGFYFIDSGSGDSRLSGVGAYLLSNLALIEGTYTPTTGLIRVSGGTPALGSPVELSPTTSEVAITGGLPGLYNPQGGTVSRRGTTIVPLSRYGNSSFWVEYAPTTAFEETTGISLVAAASALSTALGDLMTTIDMSGLAVAETTATGDLSPKALAASVQAVASAAASLAVAMPLIGSAANESSATGDPQVLVSIAAAANALAASSAALSQSIILRGMAAVEAQAAGAISQTMSIGGSAETESDATGEISTTSGLSGNADIIATAGAAFSSSVSVAGTAQVIADAAGTMAQVIDLSAETSAKTSSTGAMSLSDNLAEGVAYAININTGAITTLTNMNFERMLSAHGKTYGIKNNKIYRIEGDKDPNSTNINATLRFASSNLGQETLQRLNKIYVISREMTGIKITPIYDETEEIEYFPIAGIKEGLIKHRTSVGRKNIWYTLGLQIENINGGHIDVGGFELLTQTLNRRIP